MEPTTPTTRSESKYERLRKIGIGSYGVVFKCVNRQTGQVVAIKRYSENDSDPIIRKIAMREVRMLRQLKHPNLIKLIEVFRRKRRLHLVFDYCELTVLDVIEKYAQNCPLNLIKKIIWQLVNGVSYCHQHNCIHRDIKPENILINQAGVVKLCDFGFARNIQVWPPASAGNLSSSGQASSQLQRQLQHDREARLLGQPTSGGKENSRPEAAGVAATAAAAAERQALTEYVATRWYRAPELLVGEIYYDVKIDIWAIGCVTAELMRGEPVWPGKTDLDQLYMIKSSLGQLTAGQTHTLLTRNLYDQANVERLLNQVASPADALERRLPVRVGQPGVEFVLSCLQMDPARRPASDELLRHHYIHSARMAQFVKGASQAATGSAVGSGGLSTGFSESAAAASSMDAKPDATFSKTDGQLISSSLRSNSQALLMAANSSNNGHSPSKTASKPSQQASKRLPVAVGSSTTTTTKMEAGWPDGARGQTKGPSAELEASNNNNNKLANYKRRRQTSGNVKASTAASHPDVGAKGSLVPISQRRRTNSKPSVGVLQSKQVQVDNPATTTTTTTATTTTTKSNSRRRQPQYSSGFLYSSSPTKAPSGSQQQQQQQAARKQASSKTMPANGLFSLNEEQAQQQATDDTQQQTDEPNSRGTGELMAPPGGRQSRDLQSVQQTGTSAMMSASGSSTATNQSNLSSVSTSTSSFLPQVSNSNLVSSHVRSVVAGRGPVGGVQ